MEIQASEGISRPGPRPPRNARRLLQPGMANLNRFFLRLWGPICLRRRRCGPVERLEIHVVVGSCPHADFDSGNGLVGVLLCNSPRRPRGRSALPGCLCDHPSLSDVRPAGADGFAGDPVFPRLRWRLGEIWSAPSPRNALLFGAAFGGALLSKFTGVLLIAVVLALFLHTRFWPSAGEPAEKAARKKWRRARWGCTLRGALWAAPMVYVVYFVLSWNQPDSALSLVGSGPWAFLVRRPLMPIWLFVRGFWRRRAPGRRSCWGALTRTVCRTTFRWFRAEIHPGFSGAAHDGRHRRRPFTQE